MAKISLIKSIEAIKLHPKTGTALGVPDVTISYGALIEHVGSDRDLERFRYLGDLYACRRDAFLSATGSAPPQTRSKAGKPAAGADRVTSGLQWEQVVSNGVSVSRAKVPGGWLVLCGAAATYYPDPAHQWDGSSVE
ncbi:MAG: hypothetical protein ABSF62_18665 [Bryobacteraceae bacterium]